MQFFAVCVLHNQQNEWDILTTKCYEPYGYFHRKQTMDNNSTRFTWSWKPLALDLNWICPQKTYCLTAKSLNYKKLKIKVGFYSIFLLHSTFLDSLERIQLIEKTTPQIKLSVARVFFFYIIPLPFKTEHLVLWIWFVLQHLRWYLFIIQATQKGYEKFNNIDKLPNNLY